jgi:hypothetical protein
MQDCPDNMLQWPRQAEYEMQDWPPVPTYPRSWVLDFLFGSSERELALLYFTYCFEFFIVLLLYKYFHVL